MRNQNWSRQSADYDSNFIDQNPLNDLVFSQMVPGAGETEVLLLSRKAVLLYLLDLLGSYPLSGTQWIQPLVFITSCSSIYIILHIKSCKCSSVRVYFITFRSGRPLNLSIKTSFLYVEYSSSVRSSSQLYAVVESENCTQLQHLSQRTTSGELL